MCQDAFSIIEKNTMFQDKMQIQREDGQRDKVKSETKTLTFIGDVFLVGKGGFLATDFSL